MWYSDSTESESRRKVLSGSEEGPAENRLLLRGQDYPKPTAVRHNAAWGRFPMTADRSTVHHYQR